MCVILYKPANKPMPSLDIIAEMAAYNPDGFGFVSTNHTFKSTSYRSFIEHLCEVEDNEELLVHVRYATHGSVRKANCHPFKQGDVFFMHNGVLPIQSVNDKTDSELAFRYNIMPVVQEYGFESKEADQAIRNTLHSSRFAFMRNGKVKLYGEYYKYQDYYFSNLRWLTRSYIARKV